jgi:hypothetical protein
MCFGRVLKNISEHFGDEELVEQGTELFWQLEGLELKSLILAQIERWRHA